MSWTVDALALREAPCTIADTLPSSFGNVYSILWETGFSLSLFQELLDLQVGYRSWVELVLLIHDCGIAFCLRMKQCRVSPVLIGRRRTNRTLCRAALCCIIAWQMGYPNDNALLSTKLTDGIGILPFRNPC
jgi:hypothetical protein